MNKGVVTEEMIKLGKMFGEALVITAGVAVVKTLCNKAKSKISIKNNFLKHQDEVLEIFKKEESN